MTLEEIVSFLQITDTYSHYYYDTQDDCIELIDDFNSFDYYNDEQIEDENDANKEIALKQKEIMNDMDNRFIELPNCYKINEYSIMEKFAITHNNQTLYSSLKGKKPFASFKNALYNTNLKESYYYFKEKELYKIAIEWYIDNNLDFLPYKIERK